ncbi:MAG: hypothetical protein JWO74_4090 [Solirubrobacterales bacterium]|nr:hypothetical protein [Solirubrobacterales bacterium]
MAEDAAIGAPDQNELVIALVAAVGTDVGMVAEELTIELSEPLRSRSAGCAWTAASGHRSARCCCRSELR